MSPPRDPLYPGASFADRYTLGSVLESSATRATWSAVDGAASDARVTIEILSRRASTDAQTIERFRRAVAIGGRLDGPHFVRTLAHGEHEGRLFVVAEPLDGESLEARLDRYRRMGAGECLRWLADVANAVADARAAGVSTDGLSTKSVIFSRTGQSEVLKLVDPTEAWSLEHDGDDHRSMWAMASMLYRAVTGVSPTAGPDAPLAPSAVAPGLARALDAFFRRALSIDVERRFRSLDDFVLSFEAAAIGNDAPSLRAPRVPSDAPDDLFDAVIADTRARPWSTIFATVLSVAIVVLAVAFR